VPYTPLPDHRMPWDNDGTLAYYGNGTSGATTQLSGAQAIELQDDDHSNISSGFDRGSQVWAWLFFPEQREITGIYTMRTTHTAMGLNNMKGSNDTANGMDGTWETASLPSGASVYIGNEFGWRSAIKPVSFTGPKQSVRLEYNSGGTGHPDGLLAILHIYGEAAAGQMAHDLIFLDPDLGAGVAFPGPEDFGDQPLGTSVVRPFRIKNTSATATATNINIQCNDADFTIAEDPAGPWVVTINIASLGPGVESATMYVRSTTPAPGASLKPRFARIVVVCDAGFFG
jgi:hypothetical protein